MSRVQANRVPAVGRTIIMLGVVWALAGCSGKDKPDLTPQPSSQAMVPAAADSGAADTTGVAAPGTMEAAGTSAAAGVHSPDMDDTAVRAHEPVEPVSNPFARSRVSAGTGAYSLQLGSFRSAANAEAEVARIAALGRTPDIEVATLGGQTYHRVVLHGLADRAEAERLGEEIHSQLGITYLIRQK